jgi:hypothetical protein
MEVGVKRMEARLRILTLACLLLPHSMAAQNVNRELDSLESLINVRFYSDPRVFSVMAALNLAGFDDETPGQSMSQVRKEVRASLSDVDSKLSQRLQDYYESQLPFLASLDQPQVAYISLALLLSQPPDFRLTLPEEEMPTDAWQVRGFASLVRELYREEEVNLQGLWERQLETHRAELNAYRPVLLKGIRTVLEYFRIPPRIVLDRQIVIIPDLLNVKDIVNARNMEKTYYLVLGPSDQPANNERQLEHEYLHFLVDPLVRKFGVTMLKHDELLNVAQSQPHVRSDYQNRFLLVIGESLIEAIQLRISPPESDANLQRELAQRFRRGLILAPYFFRRLQEFEDNELISLPVYLEVLFSGFEKKEVEEDELWVRSLEKEWREERQQKEEELVAERAEVERINQVRTHLEASSRLLSEKKYDEAKVEVENLLKLDKENGSGLFYMAQITFQLKDYDSALNYFRRTAASMTVEPWVRAHSLLRAGRILASKDEFDMAREFFVRVEHMRGDLKGADKEATELLARLPQPPQ